MSLSSRGRELVVGAVIAAVFAAGFALDLGGGTPAEVPEPAAEESPTTERAVFCPPTLRAGSAFLAVASPLEETVSVGVEPGFREQAELPAGRMLLAEVEGRSPLDVIGLGSEVAASYTTNVSGRFRGTASSSCSRTASERWHFADGSSARGFDQRLLVYNPFPDEAVVKVTFHTRNGEIARAGLANLAVPSGETARIRVNDFLLRRPMLGTSVTAARGRVVVWRLLLDEGEDDRGVGVEHLEIVRIAVLVALVRKLQAASKHRDPPHRRLAQASRAIGGRELGVQCTVGGDAAHRARPRR